MIYLRERALLPLAGCLAAALALGFGAGRVTAPRASVVHPTHASKDTASADTATGLMAFDSTGLYGGRSWFALEEARRVLGSRVSDAVMYVDAPDRRAIVALRSNAPGLDTADDHAYAVVLLTEEGGRYVPRVLPLAVSSNFGRGIRVPPAASRIDSDKDGVDTDRLWGVEDVDGDGRTDVWAAEQYTLDDGQWELRLRVHSPATGRTDSVYYEGQPEIYALPQPDRDLAPGTPPRMRDWMRERMGLLIAPLVARPDDWEEAQPWNDAAGILARATREEFRPGPVPHVEFPYGADSVRYESCDGERFRFWATEDGVWGDDVRRGVAFPVTRVYFGRDIPSIAFGQRYLWISYDADAQKGPSMIAYDTRERRLSSVPVPADRGCHPYSCGALQFSHFSRRGDTLYLDSIPFRAPPAYGGGDETRGAAICGGDD